VEAAHAAAWARFAPLLAELVAELPLLRQPVEDAGANPLHGAVARRMWAACAPLRDAADGFLTPMAAVAGSVAQELIACYQRPGIARAFINLDGMPSQFSAPDINDRERRRMRRADVAAALDRRRRRNELSRRPDTIEGLAGRRAPMNPRLTREWLEYLVTVGARHDDEGWRWKIDPVLHLGGFGPWRPQWSMDHLAALELPFLGVLSGVQDDPMGWKSRRGDIEPFLPPGGQLEFYEEIGHFLHIEQPQFIADLVLEFLRGVR
jgi:pimeloyl-ACP methyl ester carboxylesterase